MPAGLPTANMKLDTVGLAPLHRHGFLWSPSDIFAGVLPD